MRCMSPFLLAVVLFGLVTDVKAARIETPMTVGFLHVACLDQSERAQGFCDGAIEAYYSIYDAWCVPKSVTHGQVKRVVKAYILKMSVNRFGISADTAVHDAISKNWPC